MATDCDTSVRILGQLLLMESVVVSLPENAIIPFVVEGLADFPGVAEVTHAMVARMNHADLALALKSSTVSHGHLHFKISDREKFEPYCQYIRNFTFLLGVILDERRQRKLIENNQAHLEQEVKSRTAELLQERDTAQRYLDIAGVMLIALDREGRIAMINRKGAELLCLEEETLIGMNWIDNFIPAEQRDEVRRVFDRLISGEKVQVEHYENSIVNSQGEQLQMSWHNTLVRDANGNITGTLSSAEDITELRRSEKALRRSQKMDAIGQLTGGIAHDFNNILGIILGNADLIKQKAREQPAIESRITIIESAAQRAANLTRQLLDFSRDESDENAVVSPNTIISGMDDLIRRTVTPQITVKSLLAENAWYVRINPGDFQDSLLNLTLNARDAMPAGGTLIFRTRVCELRDHERRRHGGIIPGEYVKVEVEDSGTGIPPEAQERIFEPFYTTKGVGKGTGLGLSMVYGFVKRSNGFIDVHSDPGCGTRFCIYLPRASAAE